MITIKHPDNIPHHSVVATIGMFDGIHLGHQHIISMVCDEAQKRGKKSAVITFAQHPQLVLRPNTDLRMIMPLEKRLDYLDKLNVDYSILLDFDQNLAKLSAREFIELIHNHYGISTLIIGFNHKFGHNREETFDDYIRYGKEIGVEIIKAQEYLGKHFPISSSIIRRLIGSGKINDAAKCLSRNFSLQGVVVHGFQNGRKIGFPTANIKPLDPTQIIPHNGVYAVHVQIEGLKGQFTGMANIGIRPTFNNGTTKSIEVHIFDFDKDIYGSALTIEFLCFIRSEQKMDSIDHLILQLRKDEQDIRKIITSNNTKSL